MELPGQRTGHIYVDARNAFDFLKALKKLGQ